MLYGLACPCHHLNGIGVSALFQHRQVDRPLSVYANNVVLQCISVLGLAYVGNTDGRLADNLKWRLIHITEAELAVRVNVVIKSTNLDIASGKNNIGLANCPHDVHRAQLSRFQFGRVYVEHELTPPAAERLGHGSAVDAGQLIAYYVLSDILKLSVRQSWAVERDQANGQAGCIGLQNDGCQRAWREIPHIGESQGSDAGSCGVCISTGLKIDFYETDTIQRTRFNVVNPARQHKEALKVKCDVAFDLLGWHA